jgi:hypothetical protein
MNIAKLDEVLAAIETDDAAKDTTKKLAFTVSYMLNRHPLIGGDYYRAYRPAALACHSFGWTCSLADRMAAKDDGSKLGLITPAGDMGRVFFPDVIVLRPVAGWTKEFTEWAHENGQYVLADLDDDLWSHEDLLDDQLPESDNYDDWFSSADGVLCATKNLVKVCRQHTDAPIYYAPSCYDYTTMSQCQPKPGRMLGDRLWLSGRQNADVEMYDEFIYPLLDELNLGFVHVGAQENTEPTPGMKGRRSFGWDTPRLFERPTCAIPQFPSEFDKVSIGIICMADNRYNDAKTETHAAELCAMGLPIVAATNHPLYTKVPGRVDPTAESVRGRIEKLLVPEYWEAESLRSRAWAQSIAKKNEALYMQALLQAVNALTK